MLFAHENLFLTVFGDIYDIYGDHSILKGIQAEGDVNITATGSIGGYGADDYNGIYVYISAGDRLNISARELCMYTGGDARIGKILVTGLVEIKAGSGAISNADENSGIWCDEFVLRAYGMIGTKESPLRIYSDRTYVSGGGGLLRSMFRAAPARARLVVESELYGEYILVIAPEKNIPGKADTAAQSQYTVQSEITLINSDTGVCVTGNISPNAFLLVDTGAAHSGCPGCEYLLDMHLGDNLPYYNVAIEGRYSGLLYVQLPIGDKLSYAEGEEIIVLTCRDGVIYAIKAIVRDGYACFYTDELGAFLVLGTGERLKLTEDGKFILTGEGEDILPFGGWLELKI